MEIFSTHKQDDEISQAYPVFFSNNGNNIFSSSRALGGLTPTRICTISWGMVNFNRRIT